MPSVFTSFRRDFACPRIDVGRDSFSYEQRELLKLGWGLTDPIPACAGMTLPWINGVIDCIVIQHLEPMFATGVGFEIHIAYVVAFLEMHYW